MPKDNRKIHSAVRHGGKPYKDGMEDELAAVMGEDQLQRLAEKGAISGNWGLPGEAVTETEATAGKKTVGKKTAK